MLQQKEFKQYSTSVQYEELSNYEFQNKDSNGGWNFFLLPLCKATLANQKKIVLNQKYWLAGST